MSSHTAVKTCISVDIIGLSCRRAGSAVRRRRLVNDCHQLRLDADHYNGTHPNEEQLEMILDFTEDVKEMMIAEGIEAAA
jgi:hypothetical protein